MIFHSFLLLIHLMSSLPFVLSSPAHSLRLRDKYSPPAILLICKFDFATPFLAQYMVSTEEGNLLSLTLRALQELAPHRFSLFPQATELSPVPAAPPCLVSALKEEKTSLLNLSSQCPVSLSLWQTLCHLSISSQAWTACSPLPWAPFTDWVCLLCLGFEFLKLDYAYFFLKVLFMY